MLTALLVLFCSIVSFKLGMFFGKRTLIKSIYGQTMKIIKEKEGVKVAKPRKARTTNKFDKQ